MKNDRKTKNELIEELKYVRRKVKRLETLLKKCKHTKQDTTERKQEEQEQIRRLATIVRDSNDAITVYDFEGRISSWNRGAELMYGYSEKEARQMSIWHLTPPNKEAEQKDFDRRLLVGEKISSFETQRLTKDGRILDVWMTVTKLVDDTGKIIAIASTERDVTERKRAEEALRESETRYRSVLQSATDAIVTVDGGGIIIVWNSGAERIFGYSYTEAVGQSLTSIISLYHPDGMKRLQSKGDQNVIGKTVEFEGLRKDKSVFPIELSLSVWEAKSEQYFTGIIRDITERKRAEKTLQENEKKYRSIFENVQDVYYETLFDGTILEVSPSIEIISREQYNRTDLIGRSMYEFYPDTKDRDTIMAALQKKGSVSDFEVRLKNKDGSFIPCSISAKMSFDAERRPEKIIGSMRDITKRKSAEKALQESELRFRSLYENTTIGLYRTTHDGNILLANPALVKMLGYTSFQQLAERNLEKDGFESSSQRKEFLEKIERDGVVHGYDSKWIRLDGKVIFVLESARAIRDSQGKTLYYDGTVEDITERRQMEEGLRQMQKMEGLGTLAGGIAHDFNNILGIILAYITSTKQYKDDTKKLDLAVDTIVKAVERGKTLVQQILTFARKTDTEFGAVEVNDVVMEIMTMIFETFPKTLTYAQNFDKSITFICVDRSQLHQVLLNLCVNARDAMPKGGVLTINTRMASCISLRNQHPDAVASSYVCIEVSDTGEGMTPETRGRIFEPFFTTKEQGKGTGLGLAVVFGIVQTHKGFIDVESELGKGTTFSIYLPASQVAEPISVKGGETLVEIPGGTETLLIVEDEEMLMMSLRMVLVEKGYSIISAGDGLEAVNIYKERMKEIALVLTDLGLPKMSGMEECAQIKKLNPSARMIIATGYLDPGMKSEFLKAGIQHYLYKPYDLKKVLKEVREVLDEK